MSVYSIKKRLEALEDRYDIGHTVWEVLTKNYGEDIQPTTNNYWLTVIVNPGDIEQPESVRQALEKERKPEQQKETT